MHRKSRKHSALLLLMAPIIAIGSSALLAGSAGATAGRTAKPTLKVCASVSGTRFLVNGKRLTLGAKCASVVAKSGVNRVTENWAPAAYRDLKSISVSPTKLRVSTSVKTATAVVRLAAKQTATVKFVNDKLATQQTGTGNIKVCKYATSDWGGSLVAGTFPFTITAGSTVIMASAIVGQCTGLISVPSGTVTVTEGTVAPYAVAAIASSPVLALGTTDLATQTGTFTVTENQTTTAFFTNDTTVNEIEICKILANNQGNLAGSVFSFNVTWTFTPPTGAPPITRSGTASVTAVASPGPGSCVEFTPATTLPGPFGIPVGSMVTVTENSFPNVAVSGVSIFPSTQNAGSTATEAIFTVSSPTIGDTSATFTNMPLGFVEVCKNFTPSSYDALNSASFSVNGGPSFTVAGGQCSVPIAVAAGTATVSETLGANFFLYNVSTMSATDPFGTRLLTGPTVNPASVTVPYGGVGNETVVTFTNAVQMTQFKICKQETSADANLSGSTFNFQWAFDGQSGSVSLTIAPVTATNPTGEVCSGLISGPDVVNPDGSQSPVTVTEEDTDVPAVQVTQIDYAGNGAVIPSESSTLPSAPPAWVTFDSGAGINVVTFTNGRTPGSNT